MPHSNNLCYDFGPYRMNATQRVLTRDGTSIPLTPKTTDILLVLLKNSGELVDKEVLLSEVWPETFVEESNLTQYIFRLRQAIKDQRTPAQYIETIPGRGYRFIAPVKVLEIPSPADQAAQALSALGRSDAPPRIAVIPFLNETGDESFEYLSDGISENLINSLSQISTLRVMSRTAVMRFKGKQIEPKRLAIDLRVDAVLLGKIVSTPSGLVMNVELVDAGNGWQLWGRSFECELNEIVEIQQEVVRQVSIGLRLRLTGDEEKRISARYTNNPLAYQAYLEGRFFWSLYTKEGIDEAIKRFSKAIECDPNYVLAYSAAIDCYLRLASNYLPPQTDRNSPATDPSAKLPLEQPTEADFLSDESKVRLRHEWDSKAAEREIRRANELKSEYPGIHQWHTAFDFARQLCSVNQLDPVNTQPLSLFGSQMRSVRLTESEEVQVYCTIAREQVVSGNYEGALLVLKRWLPDLGWPKLDHLNSLVAADLLYTLGSLISGLGLIGRIQKGNRRASTYFNGSIALLEHLGKKVLSAESLIELGRCLYREGSFEEARDALNLALERLPDDQTELISLCLSVYGCIERDSGRLQDSLQRLEAAAAIDAGQLVTGFRHLQMATTLKELGNSESRGDYYVAARHEFQQALHEFEAIGNHRNTAATENNFGYLLLWLGLYDECETHLQRALDLFKSFSDHIRAAQVVETLTQLYIARGEYEKAQKSIEKAVAVFEKSDGAALLAEALVTEGVVACRLSKFDEARSCFEGAHRIAEQCGDNNGAGRALLTFWEEMGDRIHNDERSDLKLRLTRFLAHTQQTSLRLRLERLLATG